MKRVHALHRRAAGVAVAGAVALGAVAFPAVASGAVAFGAVAFGAVAFGAVGCAGVGEGEGEGEGEGDVGAALLEAAPASCDMGRVPTGVEGSCTIVVRNRGTAPADVTSVSADFGVVEAAPGQILPGGVDHLDVTVRDTPSRGGDFLGDITLATDAGDVSFPLTEHALTLPSCNVTATVSGVSTAVTRDVDNGGFSAFVDDVVVLDGSATTAAAGGTIAFLGWSIQGVGSLSSTDAAVTTILDPALGTALVKLTAADDQGAQCDQVVPVAFGPRLSVALDTASFIAGFVAHVYPSTDNICGALDCFDLDNCGFGAEAPPEWDGVSGRTNGDPLFDPSFGAVAAVPVDGIYVVAVVAPPGVSGDAVVDVGVDGAITPFTLALVAGDLWTVADITVTNGIPSITSTSQTVDTDAACF